LMLRPIRPSSGLHQTLTREMPCVISV
jgi:hypothetical protein